VKTASYSLLLLLAFLVLACEEKRSVELLDLGTIEDTIYVDGGTDVSAYNGTDSGVVYNQKYKDIPFVQYESELVDMPSPVISLVNYHGDVLYVRDGEIYSLNSAKKLSVYEGMAIQRIYNFADKILLVEKRRILLGDTERIYTTKEFSEDIKYVFVDTDRFFIGFGGNNYEVYSDDSFEIGSFGFGFEVSRMCRSGSNYYFLSEGAVYKTDESLENPSKIVEGELTDIECSQGPVLIASNNGFYIYDGSKLDSVSKEKGMPYLRTTSVKSSDYGIFALSDKGLMLYKGDGGWEYFHSRYYIPDWDIKDIIIDGDKNIVVATAKGIGIIRPVSMTLSEKEKILYEGMKKRHNRMGFYSPARLRVAGDLLSAYTFTDDNDGQWSGMYLAAMCFKYAVTKDKSILEDARETMNSLLLLETVTEKKGFFARSVVEPELCEDMKRSGGEWHLTSDGRWCFKGNTSTDEYVGHIFGLSVYYDYCADENEKKRIAEVFGELQRYIVLNGYKIVDLDGEVTTDGHMEPEWIHSVGVFGDAGLNSAMILGGLRFAYHITGDKFFEEHFYKLARDERYFDYVRRIEDINTAVHINHDSEEMSFLALFSLLRLETDEKFRKFWIEGLENIYQTQIRERDPEFNMIYAFFRPDMDYHLNDSIRTLKEFYTHGIEWSVYNSHRVDYTLDPNKDRFGRPQSLEVFPYNQKRVIRWAENPFVLDEEGDGHSEQILTPWLLPYWMGRFLGVIE